MNLHDPMGDATPSPGQVVPRRWPRWALLLLGLAAVIFVTRSWAALEEHWDYLREERPASRVEYDTLSTQWTEKRLQQRYAGLPLHCTAYRGALNVDRYCSLRVSSHNGLPAMFVVYFLRQDRLLLANVAVPWWRHDEAYEHLTQALGQPFHSQLLPSAFVRLHGWALADGAALFFNRERSLLSLDWSSIQWSSAEHCPGGRCFNTPRP